MNGRPDVSRAGASRLPSASRPPARRVGSGASRGRGPGPFIVLAVVALLPAVALFALFRWADDRVADADDAPPPSSTVVAPPAPADPLVTSLLSMRRFPTTVSRSVNLGDLSDDLVAFFGTINERSCAAVSVDGITVGAQNPDLAVIPASNQKLVVGAVALEVLGPDARYTTVVGGTLGPDGVVQGDLHLVGGGDPLLSSDWYPTSNLERYPVTSPTSLDELADAVRDAGVTRVAGDVVGDGSRYDDEYYAPGWGVGVAGLEGGPYDALLVNDSRVFAEEQRSDQPNAAAAREFLRLLVERGVTVDGGAVDGVMPSGTPTIASIQSAPMSSVVDEMSRNSDNNTAELLVKEIGYVAAGTGSREAGLRVMSSTLAEWGIDVAPIVLADGSGLSLDNRLTCSALIEVLQRFGPDTPLGTGLPIAGQTGTLSDVFVDHPVAGRLTGKTGTLNNPPFNVDPPAVKALSGYVPVDGGGVVEYSLVLNGPTISDQSEYRPIWTALADVLAGYPSGATPAELGPR